MTATAGNTGISIDALARLDQHLLSRYVQPEKIAGCLTLISRHGETAHLSAMGSMDRERNKPMATDTIFRFYSMTKPITSVALMQLHEQGMFQLTDPVSRFIPQWRDLQVMCGGDWPNFETRPVDRPMSVRDVLSHQSGLTYGFMEGQLERAYNKADVYQAGTMEGRDLQSMIDRLAEMPLKFSPGDNWNYGVSTDVCGYLVEAISGQRFDEYLQEHIFDPLGMEDTGFDVPPEKIDRFAANYERGPDRKLRLLDDPATSNYAEPQTFFSGGGGLVSTAHDYHRFCQMLLNGGELDGARLLGPKTIELMTMNHLPDGQDLSERALGSFSETANDGVGFGLGFAMIVDIPRTQNVGSLGEYYWGGAASTIFWIDPVEDMIVIFLTQFMPSGTFNFRGQIKQILYPGLLD
ncbi:MAG: serine hydrolase [Chloroflexi bacterium]|nr:serine hydrolase [Chloroflexota bacterium]